MNELTTERTMTTRELADFLHTRPNVITENAKKALPNKVIRNGKQTYYTEQEVTILIEFIKGNKIGAGVNLSNDLIGTSTRLTPALKLKKAMEMAQEAYEEELERLKAENSMLASYLGVRQTDLMALLNSGYIYKNSMGEYRCYAEYNEYFALRPWTKGDTTRQQLMLTMKGLEYFGKKLGARNEKADC